jgi:hypothetical protein
MNIGIFIHGNIYKFLNIRHDCSTATEKGNCDVIYLIMFILFRFHHKNCFKYISIYAKKHNFYHWKFVFVLWCIKFYIWMKDRES